VSHERACGRRFVAERRLELLERGLLKERVGWGNVPVLMIAEDLAAGRLVRLDMPDSIGGDYVLEAIYRTDTPPGPAASWLVNRFLGQATAGASSETVSA